jgi:uncharacterized protein YggE
MKIAFAALVLFGAAAIAGVAQPHLAHSAAAPTKTITVSGVGTVETVPDRASFSFTVTTQADTAKAAMARNATAADAVAAALKGAKIQTSGISLNPNFTDDGTSITGYTASTTVTADAELTKLGGLIDAAVNAGANGVYGPVFSRSDRDKLYRDALKDALKDAKSKAEALADGAGLTLGEIKSVTEGASAGPIPVDVRAMDSAAKIEPGTQTIEASVTVTYSAS